METAAPSSLSNNKRKLMQRGGKGKKKPNNTRKLRPVEKHKKPTQKMIKLYKKRAQAYDSDDDEEEEEEENEEIEEKAEEEEPMDEEAFSDDEEDDVDDDLDDEFPSDEDDEEYERRDRGGGIKFTEGCRAFRTAFLKIMKKHLANDPLGPILLANKKLVAEKLLEEETEHKAKGVAKKEKHLAGEKGHVKPANYLDAKEKLLISTATKGVVKLFKRGNRVNKAQNPQKGLNPSNAKDAKELSKRRKQTFLLELKKSTTESRDNSSLFNFSKVNKSTNKGNNDEPQWAPLRDGYMLSNSKLKDWDRMPDPAAVVDERTGPLGISSDED